jgi:hypothetical protein
MWFLTWVGTHATIKTLINGDEHKANTQIDHLVFTTNPIFFTIVAEQAKLSPIIFRMDKDFRKKSRRVHMP